MITIPAVLIALTFHELAHGFAAYKLGDNTAKNAGRLTFNPISHIDILGLICMIFVGIGWAKPVPVSPYNFKIRNKKLGMAAVALAGPMANFILAFLTMFIAAFIRINSSNLFLGAFSEFLLRLSGLNVGLGTFNLLPIPPLDGSKVIMPLIPNRILAYVFKYEPYIRFVLLALLLSNLLDPYISEAVNFSFLQIAKGVGGILGVKVVS